MAQDHKITNEDIQTIIDNAPIVGEGQPKYRDMSFAEARDLAVAVAGQYNRAANEKQLRATAHLGAMVGAYYSGLVAAGTPEPLAATLATTYHEWIMEQMNHAAHAISAVKNHHKP